MILKGSPMFKPLQGLSRLITTLVSHVHDRTCPCMVDYEPRATIEALEQGNRMIEKESLK